MTYPQDPSNQRRDPRVSAELPARISIGSQLFLNGHLKDLSLKSAFIRIKNSIYLQPNDEVGFSIQCTMNDPEDVIQGLARISRLAVGEGVAIYFTKMDEASQNRLKSLFKE
jgi:hypothetical protein